MRRPTRRDEMTDGEADFLGLPERLTPEEEAEEERLAAEKLEDRRLFLYRLINDSDFRAWLWDFLVSCGTFTNTFACGPTGFPDPHATFFSLGLKQAGLNMLETFDNAAPDLVSLMRRETIEQLSGRMAVTGK